MKAVILAGGNGTRMGDLTREIPKPMICAGGIPLIEHVIGHASITCPSIDEFIVCAGYKAHVLISHFDTKKSLFEKNNIRITVLDTGETTTKAGRLLQIRSMMSDPTILLNSDDILDLNLQEVVDFHNRSDFDVTVLTNVKKDPFGYVVVKDGKITQFDEKPTRTINTGTMVINPSILDNVFEDSNMEHDIYPRYAKEGRVGAYLYEGNWHSVNNQLEHAQLEGIIREGKKTWQSLNF